MHTALMFSTSSMIVIASLHKSKFPPISSQFKFKSCAQRKLFFSSIEWIYSDTRKCFCLYIFSERHTSFVCIVQAHLCQSSFYFASWKFPTIANYILFNSLSEALQSATTALKKIRWPDTSRKDTMLMNDKNATIWVIFGHRSTKNLVYLHLLFYIMYMAL